MLFMKIDGVDGSSEEAGHEKWIILTSVQWGASRSINTVQGGKRQAAAPAVQDVVVTKPKDNSTIDLIKLALGGSVKKVVIEECKTGTTPGKPFDVIVKVELENVLVRSLSMSRSGTNAPVETLSLNFTKAVWSFFLGTETNKTSKASRVTWDQAKAEAE